MRREEGVFSEPLEFLVKLLNGAEARPMPLPRMGIDGYLGTKRLFFGRNAMEFRGATPGTSKFGAVLSIKEYPPFSGPGLLDGLLTAPHEFILTQSFAIHDRALALEQFQRKWEPVSRPELRQNKKIERFLRFNVRWKRSRAFCD